MARRNWKKVADKQFKNLSADIQDDWSDLYEMTRAR
jgi:hypothetical protein